MHTASTFEQSIQVIPKFVCVTNYYSLGELNLSSQDLSTVLDPTLLIYIIPEPIGEWIVLLY